MLVRVLSLLVVQTALWGAACWGDPEMVLIRTLANLLGCSPEAVQLIELGGYNNRNYRATIEGHSYFAKFANPNGEVLGSSLHNDICCRMLTSSLGIGPEILYHDSSIGVLITEYVDIAGHEFDLKKSEAKRRYVELLHQLHALDTSFPRSFCPFKTIQCYLQSAVELQVALPEVLHREVIPMIMEFKKDQLFLLQVPCHLDPQEGNALDDGKRLYLVDWEFSGMCDPLFDLASMSASEEFSDDEMAETLALYLSRPPSEEEWDRFQKMRLLADVRWSLFCYLHTALTPSKADMYRGFAEGMLNRALIRLGLVPSSNV